MRVYISGCITGNPNYMDQFATAQADLEAAGYEVINPAAVSALLPKSLEYSQYMKIDLCLLDMADAVLPLSDWYKSPGARLEWKYAESQDIPYIVRTNNGFEMFEDQYECEYSEDDDE